MMAPEPVALDAAIRFGFAPGLKSATHDFGTVSDAVFTVLSYPFIHADWAHLALNVAAMWLFIGALAEIMRPGALALLIAVGAAGGALAHLATQGGEALLIGASASVAAIVGAWLRSHFVNPAPLLGVGLAWLCANYALGVSGFGAPPGGMVAWEAHVGGFLIGLYAAPLLLSPVDRTAQPAR